jgi:hypothetical protein
MNPRIGQIRRVIGLFLPAWLAGCAAVAAEAAEAPEATPWPGGFGRVAAMTGAPTRRFPDGSETPLRIDDAVAAGVEILTNDGELELGLSPNARLRFAPNTRAVLAKATTWREALPPEAFSVLPGRRRPGERDAVQWELRLTAGTARAAAGRTLFKRESVRVQSGRTAAWTDGGEFVYVAADAETRRGTEIFAAAGAVWAWSGLVRRGAEAELPAGCKTGATLKPEPVAGTEAADWAAMVPFALERARQALPERPMER